MLIVLQFPFTWIRNLVLLYDPIYVPHWADINWYSADAASIGPIPGKYRIVNH